MQTHDLKIAPPWWAAVASGAKTVELRRDDRGYAVGDVLILREWDGQTYTGRTCTAGVTHVVRATDVPDLLAPGVVALSIRVVRIVEPIVADTPAPMPSAQALDALTHLVRTEGEARLARAASEQRAAYYRDLAQTLENPSTSLGHVLELLTQLAQLIRRRRWEQMAGERHAGASPADKEVGS